LLRPQVKVWVLLASEGDEATLKVTPTSELRVRNPPTKLVSAPPPPIP